MFGLPDTLHGRHLYRLVGQGVKPVKITQHQLQGGHKDRHDHGHAEHQAGMADIKPAPQIVGPDTAHHEGRGQVRGRDHVHETVGKGGAEDDLEPVGRIEQVVVSHKKSLGCLHPADGREDPEGRNKGADGHDQGCHKMDLGAHPIPAEEHDSQKGGLQEKGGQHLVTQQGA